MNAVVYYSNTGQSKAVAEYIAAKTGLPLIDIYECTGFDFNDLVLLFPVHCQNIPDAVKDFLDKADIKNLTAIATYGRMCHGNVLYEIQKRYRKNIVAAAYVPTKHTYLDNDIFCDYRLIDPLIEKMTRPSPIRLPRVYKNFFAGFFPLTRSRMGVKIFKTAVCTNCGACNDACPLFAINNGVTNDKCIRCLKCVGACPNNALKYKLSFFMRLYLKKKPVNKTVVYV